MAIRLDHLVLTTTQLEACVAFYTKGVGLPLVRFGPEGSRLALQVGAQKLNLHEADTPAEPKAQHPTAGSADFCLVTDEPLAAVQARMAAAGYQPLLGPVPRTGATHPITSLYYADPDGNLVELSNPQ